MHTGTIELAEFCLLLDVPSREVRYVLDQGFVPKGTEKSPSTGNRRKFGPGEAIWLGIVVKLKQTGIKVPLAAELADYAMQSVRTITRNLNWDWGFQPELGKFDTENSYVFEIADRKYVRISPTANPSTKEIYSFDWHHAKKPGAVARNVRPIVIVAVDLGEIAATLGGATWQV